MSTRWRFLVLPFTCLVLAAAGCSDDKPTVPGGGDEPPLELPRTADEVVTSFREVYAERDLAGFTALLDPDYVFVTSAEASTTWDLATELAVAERMFTGQAGTDGIVISGITIDQWNPYGIWQTVDAEHPQFGAHAGSLYRDYQVDLNFYVAGQDLRLRVQGIISVVVRPAVVDDQDVFTLLGFMDFTFGSKSSAPMASPELGTEQQTWTGVKSLFE
jgi:hypothetical protein